jgi:membrane fusion protein (multidrug efflux system)
MSNQAIAAERRARPLRYILVGLGLLVVVLLLAGIKGAQIGSLISMGKKMQKAGPPPETVGSAIAQAQPWETVIAAPGSISGLKSVAVSSEVPGVVTRIAFESGQVAQRDQVLVELDSSVERAQLASAKARRDLAEVTARRYRKLVAGNAASRAQLDDVEAQLRTAVTDVAAQQAQLERKVIRAPFKGRLGIRAINLGQFLNAGTMVTTLDSIGASFVDFTLPQEQLPFLKEGLPVRVTVRQDERPGPAAATTAATGGPNAPAGATTPGAARAGGSAGTAAGNPVDSGAQSGVIHGTIAAIEPTVDPSTRSVKVRAVIPDARDNPRPGMFVNVSVILPQRPTVVVVPATAIVHASYGDSVFVVEPKKPGSPGMDKTPDGKVVQIARQQFVRLGQAQGDFVAVAKGLEAGQHVVSAGAFKLRNGGPIVVDDSVKMNPSLDPHPENR